MGTLLSGVDFKEVHPEYEKGPILRTAIHPHPQRSTKQRLVKGYPELI